MSNRYDLIACAVCDGTLFQVQSPTAGQVGDQVIGERIRMVCVNCRTIGGFATMGEPMDGELPKGPMAS